MNAVTPTATLVAHTPDPERVIAAAARLCYTADTAILRPPAADAALVARLIKAGHLSPLEHASFTFLLQGVSRALTHQLVRHRIASYSQRSQRYVAHDDFDYIVPPQLRLATVRVGDDRVPAVEYYEQTMRLIARRYALLNDALGRSGEGSNEDARYVLPNACESKIFVTMNARQLLHFFEQRLCGRAQWEIRRVADAMLTQLQELAPALFAAAGPKCERLGRCPEGQQSCGRTTTSREEQP